MTQNEKQAEEILRLLPIRTREILRLLSRHGCRSEVQQLIWMVEARAAGRLRDMGDAEVTRLIPLDQIPEIHHAEKLQVQPQFDALESPRL